MCIVQSIALAILAMSTMRMICFWGPYLCILAATGICHFGFWNAIVSKLGGKDNTLLVNFIRHIILIFAIAILFISFKQNIYDELEELGLVLI